MMYLPKYAPHVEAWKEWAAKQDSYCLFNECLVGWEGAASTYLPRIAALEAKVRELEADNRRLIATNKESNAVTAQWIGKYDEVATLSGALRAELTASRQQVERLVEALNKVKTMVCGEAAPHWSADIQTTFSRGHIADICDEALAAVEKERGNAELTGASRLAGEASALNAGLAGRLETRCITKKKL